MSRPKQCCILAALVFGAFGAAATEKPATSLADTYEFAYLGGMREYYDGYMLSLPHTMTISRNYTFHNDEPPRTCTYAVPTCGRDDVVDACDLEPVLSDDSVLALWSAEGEKVYGFDYRPMDGGVFWIEALGKGSLTIGELCTEEGAECSAEHQALRRLRKTFDDLISQAVSSSECTSLNR